MTSHDLIASGLHQFVIKSALGLESMQSERINHYNCKALLLNNTIGIKFNTVYKSSEVHTRL